MKMIHGISGLYGLFGLFGEFGLCIFITLPVIANELDLELSLNGRWRFEIGNSMTYAEQDFDDSEWESILVPGNWEDSGFPGYDGYAWYRIHFRVPPQLSDKTLYLQLGTIDDVDRVYLNGRFLNGSGGLPPRFHTAWDRLRIYLISNDMLRFGEENVLAVQVYDVEAEGGIRTGEIGIYSRRQYYRLTYPLSGDWKFKPGDNLEWANPHFDDQNWSLLTVPGKWEHQGYPNLDGFAWYRKHIVLPKNMADDRWVLVLGRVDDVDQIYFNGIRIGQTGEFPERTDLFINTGYDKLRVYSVPRSMIRYGQVNVIAVRVYDTGSDGGIYEGPVGFIQRSEYIRLKQYFK
jgi:hypothetical protein